MTPMNDGTNNANKAAIGRSNKTNNPALEGIICINKPARWTSFDCVAVLRKVLGTKRIGHTGTLDPMATGLLPICVGAATKIIEYLDMDLKTYQCEMQLGIETDTLDIWGQTINIRDSSQISEAAIRTAFGSFHGMMSQIPPKYSAIKVKGKKLYQYARAGEEVERKPRNVWIEDLSVTSVDLKQQKVFFTVTCSKGTYIRSICSDVGEILGCGGVLTALTRTASGVFTLEESVDLEVLRNMEQEQILPLLQSIDVPLQHFGKIQLSKEQGKVFCNGGRFSMSQVSVEREPKYAKESSPLEIPEHYKKAYNVYAESLFLGVGLSQRDMLVVDKVFYRGQP